MIVIVIVNNTFYCIGILFNQGIQRLDAFGNDLFTIGKFSINTYLYNLL